MSHAIDFYEAYWLSPTREPTLRQLPSTSRERELSSVTRVRSAMQEGAIAYDRTGSLGHFTASAAIVDPHAGKTLLTHHRKLGIWVQLGGHCDGDTDLLASSKREGLEESGLADLQPLWPLSSAQPLPLDVDIHSIPNKTGEHDHYHFDFRFLWLADSTAPLAISAESIDLAWVPFDAIEDYSTEPSVHVLIEKAYMWLAEASE